MSEYGDPGYPGRELQPNLVIETRGLPQLQNRLQRIYRSRLGPVKLFGVGAVSEPLSSAVLAQALRLSQSIGVGDRAPLDPAQCRTAF